MFLVCTAAFHQYTRQRTFIYNIYCRIDCNFWATFSGNGHEEFHYNLHNLCTTVICIIKICTFRADSGPGRSSLALGSAVSGPGPSPCPGIYLCKHIITNAKSQKPQFKVDLCRTVTPLTLVRLIPQQSEEWQMGEEKSVGEGWCNAYKVHSKEPCESIISILLSKPNLAHL